MIFKLLKFVALSLKIINRYRGKSKKYIYGGTCVSILQWGKHNYMFYIYIYCSMKHANSNGESYYAEKHRCMNICPIFKKKIPSNITVPPISSLTLMKVGYSE